MKFSAERNVTYHARAKDRARRSRKAPRSIERISRKTLFSFSISFISLFLFSLDNYSRPIMPRVEFRAGGGACPQGYPVPAFRFTRELDRVKYQTCGPSNSEESKVKMSSELPQTIDLSRLLRSQVSRSSSLAQTIARSSNVIANPKTQLIFDRYRNILCNNEIRRYSIIIVRDVSLAQDSFSL